MKTEITDKMSVISNSNRAAIMSIKDNIVTSKMKSKHSNNNNFQFAATFSHMGPRFVISIPTKHNSDITKFVGKELDVTIRIH
jgi:hypothetical protein